MRTSIENERLHIVAVRPGIRFGTLGPLLLLFYRVAPTADDLRHREPIIRQLIRRDSGAAFLSVIDTTASSSLPDAASRRETTRQAELYGGHVVAGAAVIEGTGLYVSLLRSLVRGMLLVKKSPLPHKFFGSVDEAARHCLDALGIGGDEAVARVLAAIEELREDAGMPEGDA